MYHVLMTIQLIIIVGVFFTFECECLFNDKSCYITIKGQINSVGDSYFILNLASVLIEKLNNTFEKELLLLICMK